jgi:hypothetical protein
MMRGKLDGTGERREGDKKVEIRLCSLSGGRPLVDTNGTAALLDPPQKRSWLGFKGRDVVLTCTHKQDGPACLQGDRRSRLRKLHNLMSDMLQLVVMIPQTQALILPVTSYVSVGNPGDKLKHVGHLVVTV